MNNSFSKDENKYELASSYLDKVILLCPDYEDFSIYDIIENAESNKDKRIKINRVRDEILDLLLAEIYIEKSEKSNIYYKLTKKGREAKNLGGHTIFKGVIEKENLVNKTFREKSEEKLNYELEISKFESSFGKRIKTWSLILAAFTVIVSVIFPLIIDSTKIIETAKQRNNKSQFDSLERQIKKQEDRIRKLELKLKMDTLNKK